MRNNGNPESSRRRSARRLAGAVFVDRSGRRRRLVTLVGAALGVLLVASLSILLAGMMSSGPVAIPGWPDAEARPGDGVTTPLPGGPGLDPGGPAPAPVTSQAPAPAPSAAVPGQGSDHRRDPSGRPSKSPGKPG